MSRSEVVVVEVEKVVRMLREISKLTDCSEIKSKRLPPGKVAYRLLNILDKIDTYCETAEKELEEATTCHEPDFADHFGYVAGPKGRVDLGKL